MAETVVDQGLDTTDGDLDTSDAYDSIREIDTSKKEVRFNSELWIAFESSSCFLLYNPYS